MDTTIRISKEIREILDKKKDEIKVTNYTQLLLLMVDQKSFENLKNPFKEKMDKLRIESVSNNGY